MNRLLIFLGVIACAMQAKAEGVKLNPKFAGQYQSSAYDLMASEAYKEGLRQEGYLKDYRIISVGNKVGIESLARKEVRFKVSADEGSVTTATKAAINKILENKRLESVKPFVKAIRITNAEMINENELQGDVEVDFATSSIFGNLNLLTIYVKHRMTFKESCLENIFYFDSEKSTSGNLSSVDCMEVKPIGGGVRALESDLGAVVDKTAGFILDIYVKSQVPNLTNRDVYYRVAQ